ncbi:MAG: DUF5056 domain-containing protein [Rikenellaceae bacterium]|jgi:hypothetical protein|nr:DUF5056 domain-containing protein [Rikenellaceae bacterium]
MNDLFMNDSEQDKLISKFLKENRYEVENVDFSRKVMRKVRRLSPEIISNLLSFMGGVACCVVFFMFNGEQIIYRLFGKFISLWINGADQIILMSETKLIISLVGIFITLGVIVYQLKSDYKIQ